MATRRSRAHVAVAGVGRFSRTDMRPFIQAFDRIRAEHGVVTPQLILEAARSSGSAFHPHITWDVEKAALKAQLHEAQEILRAVVTVIRLGDRDVTVRKYHPVQGVDRSGKPCTDYQTLETVLADPLKRDVLLADFKSDYERYRARWEVMEALLGSPGTFHEIDAVLDRRMRLGVSRPRKSRVRYSPRHAVSVAKVRRGSRRQGTAVR